MAHTLDELLAKTTEQQTLDSSILTIVTGLKDSLKQALAGETLSPEAQAKVDQIFTGLETNNKALADAITANTTPPATVPVTDGTTDSGAITPAPDPGVGS